MNREDYRVGMEVGRYNEPDRDVNQPGFRIIGVHENGIDVRRVHSSYLNEEPVESWTMYWPQVEQYGIVPIPVGAQLNLL